jgi:hypothetical protein
VKQFEQIDSSLFKLVTKPPHDFGGPDDYVGVAANPKLGRHQQTERTCKRCKLVKITVHPPEGGGWREWRWGDGGCQFADRVMPECGAPLPETLEAAS